MSKSRIIVFAAAISAGLSFATGARADGYEDFYVPPPVPERKVEHHYYPQRPAYTGYQTYVYREEVYELNGRLNLSGLPAASAIRRTPRAAAGEA